MDNLIKSLTGLVDPYLIFDPKFKGREIEYLQDSQLVHLVQADVPSPKCSNCKVMMVKLIGEITMEYATIGNTDIQVSKLCLGCMSFGDGSTHS